jgi:ABC-type transporter Mla maintaining outer membrane lipid asymmetry permease subunit MlaE
MCFSKVGFLAFIAMVINCTAGMDWKSQKRGCGASGREVLGIARIYCRTVARGVEW